MADPRDLALSHAAPIDYDVAVATHVDVATAANSL